SWKFSKLLIFSYLLLKQDKYKIYVSRGEHRRLDNRLLPVSFTKLPTTIFIMMRARSLELYPLVIKNHRPLT
uniref:Uncharacterized protein n=1 Tax=Ciona intestinalis TaxID=7719 RepID=H2XN67_CIOIN